LLGLYGPTISGVVQTYHHLFESYVNKNFIGLHSFILQSIFDIGYVGLLLALIMIFTMIKAAAKILQTTDNKTEPMMAIGLLIYALLLGSVSVIPGIYIHELFYFS